MNRVIVWSAFFASLLLLLGSLFVPDSAIMWLASTSRDMNIVRFCLMALMLLVLLSQPPRSLAARNLLGVSAILFASIALVHLMNGSVKVMDPLVFLMASVVLALEALEADIRSLPASQTR